MSCFSTYPTPLGEVLLSCDDMGLTGLWFFGQKCFPTSLLKEHQKDDHPCLQEARRWLDCYFSGVRPADCPCPSLHLKGTPFQLAVWNRLLEIPYGKKVSYGELASLVASDRGVVRMSAQAVGGAVGRNPIALIVPCHRVVGADGSLTGYAGGVEKKRWLLDWEGSLAK